MDFTIICILVIPWQNLTISIIFAELFRLCSHLSIAKNVHIVSLPIKLRHYQQNTLRFQQNCLQSLKCTTGKQQTERETNTDLREHTQIFGEEYY